MQRAGDGMQRLIGVRRELDELLATLPPPVEGERIGGPEAAESGDGGAVASAGHDWEVLALERRLAALEERAERAVVHLEAQARIVEDRLDARVELAIEEATRKIEAAVSAAELRLAAVDAAQEREERVRERVEIARREAEQRVRAAERRLVEVLGRIEIHGG